MLGTARYASPEQVRGVPVDGKADVYSLAIVLVEGVTGRVPFAADTTVATLVGRLDRPLEAPAEMGPLGPVVARAGRPEPKERLDAMAFASALQAVATELPKPEPLTLAGPAAFDDNHLAALDGDPTDLGTAPAPKPAALAAAPRPGPDPDATRLTPAVAGGAVATSDVERTTLIDAPAGLPAGKGPEPAAVTAVLTSRKGRRRRRWPWVVVLMVALLGGGGAGAVLLVSSAQVPSHPVPDVIKRGQADAVGSLRALKFNVTVQEEFVDATTAGTVVDQSPKAGTTPDGKPVSLKEGKQVKLTVSKGPPPTPVPDLTGLTETEARAAIEKVGHVVDGNVARPYDEVVLSGQVMDWTPKGTSPPKGAVISLTVSAGPAPRVIPTIAGLSYDAAAAALDAKGLKVARNADVYSNDDSTAGTVVNASPLQGSSVARGTVVTLTVSKGRPIVPELKGL
ncbi:MAG: PASTA domain-containing protein, partial [Actinobacteria bacterium]|nr:PASTA domain-containing protein [Actinomycetota bacterium]